VEWNSVEWKGLISFYRTRMPIFIANSDKVKEICIYIKKDIYTCQKGTEACARCLFHSVEWDKAYRSVAACFQIFEDACAVVAHASRLLVEEIVSCSCHFGWCHYGRCHFGRWSLVETTRHDPQETVSCWDKTSTNKRPLSVEEMVSFSCLLSLMVSSLWPVSFLWYVSNWRRWFLVHLSWVWSSVLETTTCL